MEASMKKTDAGFTMAETNGEKADMIIEGRKKDSKFAVLFEALNTWVYPAEPVYITLPDLEKLQVSLSESGTVYLERTNDKITNN